MAWDFETDPEFQAKLDWADTFVSEEVEPLDLVWGGLSTPPSASAGRLPLRDRTGKFQPQPP